MTAGLSAAVPEEFAGGEDAWTNLTSLHPGDRVGIIQSDKKRVEGRFASFTDTSISITGDQPMTIEKDKVVRVYRHGGWSRTKRTLVGLAIGAGAGIVMDATLAVRLTNEGSDLSKGVFTAVGAGVGAGIGAATGNGYKTIYRRSKL